MKLIDANDFLIQNEVYANVDFNHPMYEDTLRDIVNAAPTIDAIPVEWLKAHMGYTVLEVLALWQKEQEVR